jgi:thymidylate kinase
MLTVALVGADGAGKTTVAREVTRRMDLPIRYLYMGVNLEASTLMLPTTRLILALKRRRGGRGDLTAVTLGDARRRSGIAAAVRSGLRTGNWIAEELFRETVSAWHRRRGRVVLFDRHFLADYYGYDVTRVDPERPIASRLHGWFLRRVSRAPDLVIMLDAPADVLYARKPESSVEFLAGRREEYLALRGAVPRFELVDATQPLEAVVSRVATLIEEEYDRRATRRRGGQARVDARQR